MSLENYKICHSLSISFKQCAMVSQTSFLGIGLTDRAPYGGASVLKINKDN